MADFLFLKLRDGYGSRLSLPIARPPLAPAPEPEPTGCTSTSAVLSGVDMSVLDGATRFNTWVALDVDGVRDIIEYSGLRASWLAGWVDSDGSMAAAHETFKTALDKWSELSPTFKQRNESLTWYLIVNSELGAPLAGIGDDNKQAVADLLIDFGVPFAGFAENPLKFRFNNLTPSELASLPYSEVPDVNLLDIINGGNDVVIQSCYKIATEGEIDG